MGYYVIKNTRVREYLYHLGFNYKAQEDNTGRQKEVYVFENSDLFQQALTFYHQIKTQMMSVK